MGDEFDGCECVWSHEFAMQRLLAFIRQNQDHCNDIDCIDVTAGRMQRGLTTGGDEDTNYIMMIMIFALAMIMYLIRPEAIIKMTGSKRRTQNNHSGDDSTPPPPPPPPAPPAIN